jgi:hypothetical protein
LIEEAGRPEVDRAVVTESRSLNLGIRTSLREEIEGDIARWEALRLDGAPDAVENVVAVCFEDNLRASAGHLSKKIPDNRLPGRV